VATVTGPANKVVVNVTAAPATGLPASSRTIAATASGGYVYGRVVWLAPENALIEFAA
jgi:hypothetical protein